jgi:hypothetical protein
VNGTSGYNDQALPGDSPSRQCDFCRRELREDFLFCPFCGRRISSPDEPRMKWYHSRHAIIFALATLGPFALPLVWSNPRYSVAKKTTITVLTLALTALLVYLLVVVFVQLLHKMQGLMNIY